MNILLVCNKYPFPPRDGGSLATYNMAKGLAGQGCRVDLLAMNTSKHFSPGPSPFERTAGLNSVRTVFADTSISWYGLLSNLLFSGIPYNAARFIRNDFDVALSRMLTDHEYDIVQLEGLYLLPYIKTIRRGSNAKIVYRAHNFEQKIWEGLYIREKNIFRRRYLKTLFSRIRKFEKGFVNAYDILVPVTSDDLALFFSAGNNKPSIAAPFGVCQDGFSAMENTGNGHLLIQYIGALDWLPNIEALEWFIRNVWPGLRERHPGLRFRVAGRNANKHFVKFMTGRGIDFEGEVESALAFLSGEGILIVPLFSGSGIRVRIIEAMSMGKPVVATTLSVAGIPVENGKHLLLADNAGEFTESIGKLLTNRDFAFKMGRNANDFSRSNYDNDLVTGRLVDFYKKHIR